MKTNGHYPPAVARLRDKILDGNGVRELARKAKITDSQVVRLLNGKARRPSYHLVATVGRAIGRDRTVDAFYAKLERLWKLMDREKSA